MKLVAAVSLALISGCAAPEPTIDTVEREEIRGEEGFPTPISLEEFGDKWFAAKRTVAILERAPEGDGFRVLGVDVDNATLLYQVVGSRDQVADAMALIGHAGRDIEGCGIGFGTFTPPPVPPPTCGGLRCEPPHYVEKARAVASLSCP
jgi:hypothetical protein